MYYPQSKIITNLYTNGGEYILSTTKESYIGYYFEISSGQKYTGKTPQDGINILLINPPQTTNLTSGKTHQDFFAGRVTSYAKSTADWDDL